RLRCSSSTYLLATTSSSRLAGRAQRRPRCDNELLGQDTSRMSRVPGIARRIVRARVARRGLVAQVGRAVLPVLLALAWLAATFRPAGAAARSPDASPGATAPLVAILCYHDLSDDPDRELQTVSPQFLSDQIR